MDERIDETVPGGRYVGEDGQLHDANGKPLKEEVRSQEPEETLQATSVQESQPEQTLEEVPAETVEPEPPLPDPEPTPEPAKPARKRKA